MAAGRAFVVLAAALAAAAALVDADTYPGEAVTEVTHLPGWNATMPSRMYSGFTYAGVPPNGQGEMYTHWVLFESEGNPKNDPLVIWYQGGPGASSLFGLFVEFGPLLLNEQSLQGDAYARTGVPQLIRNPYGWSRHANLMVVDQPAPVGFSYCTPAGPAAGGTSCGNWRDDLAAVAQHTMLTRWIQQMPQFAANPIYITGESYAGVYVPTIVRELVQNPMGVNLAGFAVGDGCMGTEVLCGPVGGPFWTVEFMHGHGQFSNRLYRQIQATCSDSELQNGNLSPACQALMTQMYKEVGSYYSYNLYDECYSKNIFSPNPTSYWSHQPNTVGGALNDYPCAGPAQNMWLNRSDVRTALAVPVNANYFSGDNGVGFNYSLTEKNLLPFYLEVIQNGTLHVLVYNGDTDPGINSFITQDRYTQYFDSMQLPLTESWRPWTLDGNIAMGGYVFRYASTFSFATIRGSGHMVPEFKPQAAAVLLDAFLAHRPLPALNTSSWSSSSPSST